MFVEPEHQKSVADIYIKAGRGKMSVLDRTLAIHKSTDTDKFIIYDPILMDQSDNAAFFLRLLTTLISPWHNIPPVDVLKAFWHFKEYRDLMGASSHWEVESQIRRATSDILGRIEAKQVLLTPVEGGHLLTIE